MIYSPGYIAPKDYPNLVSQIDNMPTVLQLSYQSKFFGQDVLQQDYKPRALISPRPRKSRIIF
jgi:phosphoglycerol transferase MdoB-like AlkP superfamily enzyme